MTELDKYLRVEKDVTLKEALLADENIIDEKLYKVRWMVH